MHLSQPSPRSEPDQGHVISELWHRGDLGFKLHVGQDRIEEAFQKVKGLLFVANVSRRFGKTDWAAKKCLEYALQIPGGRIKVASAFLTNLEEFTIPTFNRAMRDMPSELKPRWIETKKKWIFHNGAEIKLVGLDRHPDGLRGTFADLVVFEEAREIKKLAYLYSSVVVPMTMYRKRARVILISTPPETPAHPFRDFCIKARQEDAYIEITIDDNPFVNEAMKAKYKAECLTDDEWLREYYCKFVIDTARAIIPEWRAEYCAEIERDELFRYWQTYEAMDLGVRHHTVCLFFYYDFQKARAVFEGEVSMSGPTMTTDVLAAKVKEKELALWDQKPVFYRAADNNNLLLLNDLASKHGLPFNPTTKDTLHQMVNDARIMVKQGRVVVSKNCPMLLGCLEAGIWNEKRTEFDESPVFGHYDALAAFIYGIRAIRQDRNPLPATHGMSDVTHYIAKNLDKRSPIADTFQKAKRKR